MSRPLRPVRAVAIAATLLTLATAALVVAPSAPASVAGITTHAWMALRGIDFVADADLKALLEAHRDQVRSGAQFPDSGYWPGNTYGEEAHWQRFLDAYSDVIMDKPGCGDLTAVNGPCAAEIAHLFGTAAHGIGDEVFDWLFEPNSPDLDEYYTPESLGSFAGEGGQETQMDIVAIHDHRQPTGDTPPPPSTDDIMEAFDAVGFTGATGAELRRQLTVGSDALNLMKKTEAYWAPIHIHDLKKEMPWMSHNLVTAPGGVDWAAKAIAGHWASMWGRLLGDQPATVVTNVYPADGQRRIPASGWDRAEILPGSHRGRGGAKTRVAAVLSDSRPYSPNPNSVQTLPEGAFVLREIEGGELVPIKPGWAQSVPYGVDPGERMVGVQPADDLQPCTWYGAEITSALVDSRQQPVTPKTWSFRTGTATGGRCPDDPYRPTERFVRAAHQDVLGRDATDAGLKAWIDRFERGTARGALSNALLGSTEFRRRLVVDAFQSDLDRAPDAAGAEFWVTYLATRTPIQMRVRLLGSSEAFAAAGGTNEAYVADLYRRVLGREADPEGLAYWTPFLDSGGFRSGLAQRLLLSGEATRGTVTAIFDELLDRPPSLGDLHDWSRRISGGTDQRELMRTILNHTSYYQHAQQTGA